MNRKSFFKSYGMSLVLIGAVAVGSLIGILFKEKATVLKPFGDVFLNALFAAVVPLVFFVISSSVAGMATTGRLLRILGWMLVVFVATGVIASSTMMAAVKLYPPAKGVQMNLPPTELPPAASAGDQIVKALTVPDFPGLLSKKNMLALIVFAALVGLATSAAGDKGRAFAAFLISGNEVFLKIISFIMYYAPIGLAACFATIIGGEIGPNLLTSYARAMMLYYPVCILYFFIAFTFYAYLAGRSTAVRKFWGNIAPPTMMAVATSSSFATIPLNLRAADRIGVPRDISEMVIPIGAQIHMDGSCLAAIIKIAFLCGLFGIPLNSSESIVQAIGIAILSGAVMSGIPGGGFAGEILIVTMYGFRPEALVLISTIGTLVDPPATMVNAIGDNVASMILARILGGREWMKESLSSSNRGLAQDVAIVSADQQSRA